MVKDTFFHVKVSRFCVALRRRTVLECNAVRPQGVTPHGVSMSARAALGAMGIWRLDGFLNANLWQMLPRKRQSIVLYFIYRELCPNLLIRFLQANRDRSVS